MCLYRFALTTLLLVSVLLSGCNGMIASAASPATDISTETPTHHPTLTNTATLPPTATLTLTPTLTPQPTMTPTWVMQGPGKVVCPILLYHHFGPASSPAASIYYTALEDFDAQLKALRKWGYTSISISQLVEALMYGAPLPSRPVVITFDDGNLDVYSEAFPIMQKYGFTGVVYIIANSLHADGYMSVDMLKVLISAGWEVGSHSMTHPDLRLNHDRLNFEIAQSRIILQDALGVPVRSFAYPYGGMDPLVSKQVQSYGYTSAVGLGTLWNQSVYNLYYLSRRPVPGGVDLQVFASYLPWSGATPTPAQVLP